MARRDRSRHRDDHRRFGCGGHAGQRRRHPYRSRRDGVRLTVRGRSTYTVPSNGPLAGIELAAPAEAAAMSARRSGATWGSMTARRSTPRSASRGRSGAGDVRRRGGAGRSVPRVQRSSRPSAAGSGGGASDVRTCRRPRRAARAAEPPMNRAAPSPAAAAAPAGAGCEPGLLRAPSVTRQDRVQRDRTTANRRQRSPRKGRCRS